MKISNLRKLHILIRIGIVIFVLGLIIVGIGMDRQSGNQAKLARYTVLTDEAAVRDALSGSPETYILLNAPLTGDTCEDPMGILQQEYVCLEYSSYYYCKRERQNDREVYDYSWDWNDTVSRNGSNLMLYGDIPLNEAGYHPHNPTVDLGRDTVKAAYVRSLYTDGITSNSYYYPDGIGDTLGNVRYKVSGIRQGAEVALMARLGGGTAELISLYDEDIPPISGYNDMASLEYALDEDVGAMALVGFVALAAGFVLMLLGGFDMLYGFAYGRGGKRAVDTKKNPKKAPKKAAKKPQKTKKRK